jgi:ParB-like nuclease domain
MSRVIQAEVICEVIRANWMLSNREIAKRANCTHRTIAKYRKELEKSCEIGERLEVPTILQASLDEVGTFEIQPTPENCGILYEPIRDDDPEFLRLVRDIAKNGILEPIVTSADGYILSGHRRHKAAKKLNMRTVPVRVRDDVRYEDDRDRFVQLLVSYNSQRVKSTDTMIREGIATMSGSTRQAVRKYRRDAASIDGVEVIELYGEKKRSKIREKISLFNAIKRTIYEHEECWPLSDRKVFYLLLNIEGLLRNDVRKTPFVNDEKCYNDVTDMITRMRLDGSIPFDSIGDETRPVVQWDTHRSVQTFVDKELRDLFSGYYRDLLQSQPNHIELLVEKNTVASSLRGIAAKYTLPMTSGRGYSSLPPRKVMVDRFRKSGREKLVIVVVTDCDPEGFDIPNSFGLSLRDDFELSGDELVIVKAALTYEQSQQLDLHQGQLAKEDSSRFPRYQELFGDRCWELEAVPTEALREMVEDTIRGVLDIDAFEQEVEREEEEQSELDDYRERVRELLNEGLGE